MAVPRRSVLVLPCRRHGTNAVVDRAAAAFLRERREAGDRAGRPLDPVWHDATALAALLHPRPNVFRIARAALRTLLECGAIDERGAFGLVLAIDDACAAIELSDVDAGELAHARAALRVRNALVNLRVRRDPEGFRRHLAEPAARAIAETTTAESSWRRATVASVLVIVWNALCAREHRARCGVGA